MFCALFIIFMTKTNSMKTIYLKYHNEMIEKSPAFRNYARGIHTDATAIMYTSTLKLHIMPFAVKKGIITNVDAFDELVKLDTEQITDFMLDFIDTQTVKPKSIVSYIASVEKFFDMNRKIFHKKIVRNSIPKDTQPTGGLVPVTDEEVYRMLQVTKIKRNIALVHFIASTGMRPGAIRDPVLQIGNLVEMPHPKNSNISKYCYAVRIYDNSREGYWAFLTPEATKALDDYLEYRKSQGVILTDESVLFEGIMGPLTEQGIRAIFDRLVKMAGIERHKVGKTRWNKATIYMFRKRFNTKLKLNNAINSNIAEKLMAHSNGLDGTYFQPTREECYAEFCKAIEELTIDPVYKQQQKIKELEKKNSELIQKPNINVLQQLMNDPEGLKQLKELLANTELREITSTIH